MLKAFRNLLPIAFLASIYLMIYTLTNLLVYSAVGGQESPLPSYYWVQHVYFYGKRQQMFSYLANSIVLFLVLFGLIALRRGSFAFKSIWNLSMNDPVRFFEGSGGAVVSSFLFWQAFHERQPWVRSMPLVSFVLASVLAVCWLVLIPRAFSARSFKELFGKGLPVLEVSDWTNSKYFRVLLTVGLAGFCFMYWKAYEPLYNERLPFLNEYLNVESTFDTSGGKVRTIRALNSIEPLGIRIEEAHNFDMNVSRPELSGTDDQAMWDLAKDNPYVLHFDTYTRKLVAVAPIRAEIVEKLSQLPGVKEVELKEFLQSTELRESRKAEDLSKKDLQFLKEFSWSLTQQVYSRWYIHHHNFVFGPMNKVDLGYDWKKVFFQYGVLGGLVQLNAAKAFFGEFNLQNYFKTWVVFFMLYFVMFIFGLWFITRSLPLTFFGTGLFLSFVYTQTFEYVFLGPGLNPIRHFLDVFVFLGLALYMKKRSPVALFFGSLAAFLNFCLNPEFGLFCYCAFLFGLGFYAISERVFPNKKELGVLVAFALLHAIAWRALRVGTEGVVSLYLGGFFSPTAPYGKVLLCFLALFIALAVLIVFSDKFAPHKLNLFLATAIYSVLILSYCLWGRTWNHLVNVSPILVLSVVIFADMLIVSARKVSWVLPMKLGLIAFSVFGVGLTVRAHIESRRGYFSTLEQYENSRWKIPGAKILTSIPEKPFAESIDLISRYRTDRKAAMFSKYDNILLLLSHSYSPLPANELMAFMMSPAEMETLRNFFDRESPEIIFADVDMLAPVTDELIDPNVPMIGGLFIESSMRLERVNNLKSLFAQVSKGYELVESAGLLSVWKKKR